MEIKIYIADLAAYNEGKLVGEWVTLPVDDMQKVIDSILLPGHEEYTIQDYEAPFEIKEYDSPFELNKLAKRIEEMSDHEKEDLQYVLQAVEDVKEALKILESGDYRIYTNCHSMEDVAMAIVEELGVLDNVPENLRYYFDYEKLGRDLEIDGSFYYVGNGVYVEIIN